MINSRRSSVGSCQVTAMITVFSNSIIIEKFWRGSQTKNKPLSRMDRQSALLHFFVQLGPVALSTLENVCQKMDTCTWIEFLFFRVFGWWTGRVPGKKWNDLRLAEHAGGFRWWWHQIRNLDEVFHRFHGLCRNRSVKFLELATVVGGLLQERQ